MLKNIFLEETITPLPYVSKRGRSNAVYPTRNDPRAHADFISHKLEECKMQSLTQKQVAAIRYKEGVYLEFSGG